MEKLWYIVIGIAALLASIIFFILGYSNITASKTKNKWQRAFWISVTVIMAGFYYFTSKVTTNIPTNIDRPPPLCYYPGTFTNLQKINWDRLHNQLFLLKKAMAEDKINNETYKKIILQIKDDLRTLDDTHINDDEFKESYEKAIHPKDENIETFKKKAKELIDKIELNQQ